MKREEIKKELIKFATWRNGQPENIELMQKYRFGKLISFEEIDEYIQPIESEQEEKPKINYCQCTQQDGTTKDSDGLIYCIDCGLYIKKDATKKYFIDRIDKTLESEQESEEKIPFESCTICMWNQAKYEFKCEGCNNFSNFKYDNEERICSICEEKIVCKQTTSIADTDIKQDKGIEEEKIQLELWKFKNIKNAIRLSHRINNCHTKETAFDRIMVEAKKYTDEII